MIANNSAPLAHPGHQRMKRPSRDEAQRIDTRIFKMVSCCESWTLEKPASQTALQPQGTRGKVGPTSASPWMWRRARRGGTGSPMAVKISGFTLCPSDDLTIRAGLERPRMVPVDRSTFNVDGWVVSKAPVIEVEFVDKGIVVACEVSRPSVATEYGSLSQVGFRMAIETAGLAPAFTVGGEGGLPGWTPTRDRRNSRQAITTTGDGPSARI